MSKRPTVVHGDRFDRYLRIVRWARNRYRAPDGTLLISRRGVPSRYSIVEHIAAVRVLGFSPTSGPRIR